MVEGVRVSSILCKTNTHLQHSSFDVLFLGDSSQRLVSRLSKEAADDSGACSSAKHVLAISYLSIAKLKAPPGRSYCFEPRWVNANEEWMITMAYHVVWV